MRGKKMKKQRRGVIPLNSGGFTHLLRGVRLNGDDFHMARSQAPFLGGVFYALESELA